MLRRPLEDLSHWFDVTSCNCDTPRLSGNTGPLRLSVDDPAHRKCQSHNHHNHPKHRKKGPRGRERSLPEVLARGGTERTEQAANGSQESCENASRPKETKFVLRGGPRLAPRGEETARSRMAPLVTGTTLLLPAASAQGKAYRKTAGEWLKHPSTARRRKKGTGRWEGAPFLDCPYKCNLSLLECNILTSSKA